MNKILVEVSVGELLDKISILEIKKGKIKDPKKLEYIDEVFVYSDEDELLKLIEHFKPDLRVLGEDYLGKRFTGDHLNIPVLYTSRAHGWSTTKLKDLITQQTYKQNPKLINVKSKKS